MGELPWWTVQGQNEPGILLYEKERNIPPVCATGVGVGGVNWITDSSIVDACLILCLV